MRWIPSRQRIQHSPQSSHGTMPRWIGLLILTLLIGSAGSTRAEALPDPAIATSKPPVTIRFVSWKPDHPRVWEEVLADFARAHPHISIVRELAPHSSTAYHDLLTQKLKNRDAAVDVFFIDIIWVPEFATAGWARPLDDRFSPALQQAFLPAAVDVGRYDTHVYGVPSRIDAGLLYYRQDLLDKYGFSAPTTWPELVH